MEKSTSRARRNGNNADPSRPTIASDLAAGLETALERPAHDRVLTPGQQARQRLEEAAGTPLAALPDAFVDERNDVLAVINELEDQLDRHQEVRETLERELSTASEKLQAANTRTQELEWQLVTFQTRIESLEQVRQQAALLEEELGDANARAHRNKEQVAALEKERTQLRNELKAANKQLDELWSVRKERDGLRADHKSLSNKVEDLERSQREQFEERGRIQAELQQLQAEAEEVTNERNQLQITVRTHEDRIRELVQIQEKLADKIEALRTEKKTIQAQVTHLERENARLAEQRQFYECELTTLRNQNRTAEAALTSVKKAFSEVRIALTDTKARARRRVVESWPRIGTPPRSAPEEDVKPMAEAETTEAASAIAEETPAPASNPE